MIGRILAGIAGLLLLLPGLCTLGFGVMFASNSFVAIAMWIWWFIIGGAFTWGGIAILMATFRR